MVLIFPHLKNSHVMVRGSGWPSGRAVPLATLFFDAIMETKKIGTEGLLLHPQTRGNSGRMSCILKHRLQIGQRSSYTTGPMTCWSYMHGMA